MARHPDLGPERLLQAYASGWFPMGSPGTRRIDWYSPDPRGVIPLDAFHIPSRLSRVVRRERYEVRIDTAFETVMRRCAARDETWITDDIVEAYTALHRHGFAHSIEAWQGEALVGGLYGVALRGAFFGESMFHEATDASKVALVALVTRLRERAFEVLDVQWTTPHLEQFGARTIPRREYLQRLTAAMSVARTFV